MHKIALAGMLYIKKYKMAMFKQVKNKSFSFKYSLSKLTQVFNSRNGKMSLHKEA
jgi:hypothetical protein